MPIGHSGVPMGQIFATVFLGSSAVMVLFVLFLGFQNWREQKRIDQTGK